MSALSSHEDLARLRALVEAQQAELVAHRARLARLERRRRGRRRLVPLALVAALVALLPLSLLAANPFFSDLGTAAPVHRDNIQAIGNAGITTGFENPADPTARLYDPKAGVTREEMASFLARTAGLGGNPPVANALTAQTAARVGPYAPADLLRVAQAVVANSPTASPPQLPTQVTAVYPAFQSVGTVTIVAPADGYVLVLAKTIVASTANHGAILQITGAAGDPASPPASSADLAASQEGTVTIPYVFPVIAGSRTFGLAATKGGPGAATDVRLAATTLTALFIPFGYNGGSALQP